MCAQAAPRQDRAAPVISPAIESRMPWHVVAVTPLANYQLRVQFVDGTTGQVDMRNMILSPDAGVFAALADQALFRQIFVEYGAVTWPGELDLAPDAMHRVIREAGVWILS